VKQLEKFLSSLNLKIPLDAIKNFGIYANEIINYNQKVNLVSEKDANFEKLERHFVDSLLIFKTVETKNSFDLLDMGSGAGLPGIPIKLIKPEVKMILLESIRKKALFLQKMVDLLNLSNIEVINKRAEELCFLAEFQNRFNIITAKAFGKLAKTIKFSFPLLKKGGILVAYKGENYAEEIEEAEKLKEKLGFSFLETGLFDLPEVKIKRWLVRVEKV
jgi:16S rRNA (guanine527-N7)-methyltransferase